MKRRWRKSIVSETSMEWSQEIPDNTEKELIQTLTGLFRAGHMTKKPKLPDKGEHRDY